MGFLMPYKGEKLKLKKIVREFFILKFEKNNRKKPGISCEFFLLKSGEIEFEKK
jgi:hypothetical protein